MDYTTSVLIVLIITQQYICQKVNNEITTFETITIPIAIETITLPMYILTESVTEENAEKETEKLHPEYDTGIKTSSYFVTDDYMKLEISTIPYEALSDDTSRKTSPATEKEENENYSETGIIVTEKDLKADDGSKDFPLSRNIDSSVFSSQLRNVLGNMDIDSSTEFLSKKTAVTSEPMKDKYLSRNSTQGTVLKTSNYSKAFIEKFIRLGGVKLILKSLSTKKDNSKKDLPVTNRPLFSTQTGQPMLLSKIEAQERQKVIMFNEPKIDSYTPKVYENNFINNYNSRRSFNDNSKEFSPYATRRQLNDISFEDNYVQQNINAYPTTTSRPSQSPFYDFVSRSGSIYSKLLAATNNPIQVPHITPTKGTLDPNYLQNSLSYDLRQRRYANQIFQYPYFNSFPLNNIRIFH